MGDDGKEKEAKFAHPFFQGALMFLGELSLLAVYYGNMLYKKRKGM